MRQTGVWLGHILRMGLEIIVFQTIVIQSKMNVEGNLLMDATQYTDIDDLTRQVMDRARWRELTHALK